VTYWVTLEASDYRIRQPQPGFWFAYSGSPGSSGAYFDPGFIISLEHKDASDAIDQRDSGMSDFRIRRQPASLPLASGSYCGTQTSRFEGDVHLWHPGERGGAVYPEATVASGLTCSSCPEYSRGNQMRGSCVRCPAAPKLASHQSCSAKIQNRQQRWRTSPALT
jgi:hypothetical protein